MKTTTLVKFSQEECEDLRSAIADLYLIGDEALDYNREQVDRIADNPETGFFREPVASAHEIISKAYERAHHESNANNLIALWGASPVDVTPSDPLIFDVPVRSIAIELAQARSRQSVRLADARLVLKQALTTIDERDGR